MRRFERQRVAPVAGARHGQRHRRAGACLAGSARAGPGVRLARVDAILVTHAHADDVLDLDEVRKAWPQLALRAVAGRSRCAARRSPLVPVMLGTPSVLRLRIGGVRLPDRLLRHSRGLVASARRSRRPRARRLGDKSQRTHLTSPKRSRPPGGSAGLRTLLRAPAIRCGPASRSPTTGWSWMSRLPRRSIRSLRAARRPACIDRTKHRRSKTSPACPVSARRTSP